MVTGHRKAEIRITDELWAPVNYLMLHLNKKEPRSSSNPKLILKLKETKMEDSLLCRFSLGLKPSLQILKHR